MTPQSALFGFFNIGNQQQNFLAINHLLLIFKHYLYISREHGAACFTSLELYLIKIKTIKQNISPCSSQKKENVEENGQSLKISSNKYISIIVIIVIFLFLSIKDLLVTH